MRTSGGSATTARDPILEIGEAYLLFRVEASGAGHARAIIDSIREEGYEVSHENAS